MASRIGKDLVLNVARVGLETLRLGVDVGGTFTDIVLVDDKSRVVATEKVLTTHPDPTDGIVHGCSRLREQKLRLADVREVIHGTTLVGNAIIVRTETPIGLITTRGFRDVLQFVGRELKYDIYDPNITYPAPVVPRHLCRAVDERIDHNGQIIRRLDVDQARRTVRALLDVGVPAICVSLLHAYLNPVHENALLQIIRDNDADVPVSLSHAILPEIREYERTTTTALNAYVQPRTHDYLERLSASLRGEGIAGSLYLMTSSGNMITAELAAAFPIQLIESGPAAGALFAAEIGQKTREDNLISFDMGGTTAKLCVIKDARPIVTKSHETGRVKRFHRGSGLPVSIPMLDLLEIGAGGGSIAEINELGLLQVGPRSAGSEPGPSCYKRGGQEPTVTDANLVLGFLNPEYFLGGQMVLDSSAAAHAIDRGIAAPLGMTVVAAAAAINRMVTDSMAEAARVHSVEMNVDIRRFPLVAFGGAGPVHAYGIAQRLKLPSVIFPPDAGVLSAVGLLAAPLAFESSRSMPCELNDLDFQAVRSLIAELKRHGEEMLAGAGMAECGFEISVDVCYVGQGYEVKTAVSEAILSAGDVGKLKAAFDDEYKRAYGRRLASLPAKCLTWRVLTRAGPPALSASAAVVHDGVEGTCKARRRAHFPEYGEMPCTVYERSTLRPGFDLDGPALIEDRASTIVVPPIGHVTVDACLNVLMTLRPEGSATPTSKVTGTPDSAV